MCQVIPFKRTDWKAEFGFYKEGEFEKVMDKTILSTIVNNYVKNHWSKKVYR